MLESNSIYILGYSGHAYVAIDIALANNLNVKGYFDFKMVDNNPYKIDFLGSEYSVDIRSIVKSDVVFPGIGDNNLRKKAVNFIESNNLNQTTLIDLSASVSLLSSVNKSTLICPNTVVNSMTVIDKGCIINSGAIIEHECKIGEFSHIAPGAVLAGNVRIGINTLIGANAVVREGIKVGNNATVGAGAVVINDISDGEMWVGNPARRIR
ncbi:acetyltransferase [Urechidicola vernalis]|uniref:Acetyltransferase n=1 Tax=Urechidicola vernalis TaxID=3075600 RepID=A0ABU2Y7I2_9FLAO|nr:acetyltransferase [Urechidicola sp. P050]MDT0554146.1 acetyltransferase [Urechidicola sp. P050]